MNSGQELSDHLNHLLPHFADEAREGKGLSKFGSEMGPELPVLREGNCGQRTLTLGHSKRSH